MKYTDPSGKGTRYLDKAIAGLTKLCPCFEYKQGRAQTRGSFTEWTLSLTPTKDGYESWEACMCKNRQHCEVMMKAAQRSYDVTMLYSRGTVRRWRQGLQPPQLGEPNEQFIFYDPDYRSPTYHLFRDRKTGAEYWDQLTADEALRHEFVHEYYKDKEGGESVKERVALKPGVYRFDGVVPVDEIETVGSGSFVPRGSVPSRPISESSLSAERGERERLSYGGLTPKPW